MRSSLEGVFICSFLLLSACSHKSNIITPVAPQGCVYDTAHVSYQYQVKPIISQYCYACHSTAAIANGTGLNLEDFTSFKSYLNNYYRNDSIYGSKFLHIINQSGQTIYMPPAGKLSDCQLSIISSWIKEGAAFN